MSTAGWPRVGVLLPYGSDADIHAIVSFATAAELSGAAGLWSYDMIGRATAHAEPLSALAACAAVTDRVELGTSILQLPLRRRAQLLQQVLTVQALSRGRFRLGVGAGSTAADFALAGGPEFEARFRILGEMIQQLRIDFDDLGTDRSILPGWTTTAPPPILIGSWARGRWIERAATEYQGWISSAAKTDRRTIENGVRRFRDAGGARALVTNVALEVTTKASAVADDAPFNLRGSIDVLDERLRWLRRVGYDDVIVTLPRNRLDHLQQLLDHRT